MLHVGVQLEFDVVHEVLGATVLELKRNQEKIHCPGPKDDVDTVKVREFYTFLEFLKMVMKCR